MVLQSDNDTGYYDDHGEAKTMDKLNSTFWQGVGLIGCVQSVACQEGGVRSVHRGDKPGWVPEAGPWASGAAARGDSHKLQPLASKRMWVLDKPSLEVCGGAAGHIWRYNRAPDLSSKDPFIS